MTKTFISAILGRKDFSDLDALGRGLAAVAAKVPEQPAAADVARMLVSAIEDSWLPDQLRALSQGLAALPATLTDPQKVAVTKRFQSAIEVMGNYYSFELLSLGQSLALLPEALTKAQASAVTKTFVSVIDRESYDYFDQLPAFGQVLAALPTMLTELQASAVTKQFVSAIQDPRASSAGKPAALGQSLAAVAAKVPTEGAEEVAKAIVSAMQDTRDSARGLAFSQGLTAVAPAIGDDRQTAVLLFRTLKNPFIPRDPITDAFRKRFPDAPRKEQGFWALIEWAEKEGFCGLDLEAPLPQPPKIVASPTPSALPMVNEIKGN